MGLVDFSPEWRQCICMYVVVRGGISDGVGNDPFLCMKVAPVQHLFLAF